MTVAERNRPADGRLFAIGDIHGCSMALEALTETINPSPTDTIVTLGDYIDGGPDSKGVVEQLIALSGRCRLVPLLGNHEEMLLHALESKAEYRYWLKFGGGETLKSYSPRLRDMLLIPPEHTRFMRTCRDYFETDTHIFVHANYDYERSMDRTGGTKMKWEPLDVKPLRPHCSGKTVVVGHTPQSGGEVLDLGFLVCIDTDCWRGGWLTALQVGNGELIQTNEHKQLRRFRRHQ